jgi:CubicO group peptidase (beta-lactamase class C family)
MIDFLFSGISSATEISPAPVDAAQRAQIEALLDDATQRGWLNCAVQIAGQDHIVISRTVGFEDFGSDTRLTDASIMPLASLSKQFTAFAVLSMFDAGTIDIDRPVADYIEGFPYETITVRQLIEHSSGLPSRDDLLGLIDRNIPVLTNDDFVSALIENAPDLDSEPGSEFEYNNSGYIVLASLVEIVSGQSVAELLEDELASRGLSLTISDIAEGDLHTPFYDLNPETGQWIAPHYLAGNRTHHRLMTTTGPGNLAISSNGLLEWADAYRRGELVDEATLSEWFSAAGEDSHYAAGLWARQDETGRTLWHWGRQPGVRSAFYNYLDLGISFSMLCNTDNVYANPLAVAIDTIIRGGEASLPTGQLADALERVIAHRTPEEIEAYGRMLHDQGYLYDPMQLNGVAHRLWEREAFDKGMAVLRLNAEFADANAVPHLILADGYTETGQPEHAIAPLERAIAILESADTPPRSWINNIRGRLERLRSALDGD